MRYIGCDKYEIYIGEQKVVANKDEILELISNFNQLNKDQENSNNKTLIK